MPARRPPLFRAPPEVSALFPPISGNAVNGLGEEAWRAPSPFFWHPPERQTHGRLQQFVIGRFHTQPEISKGYSRGADRGPKRAEKAPHPVQRSAAAWTRAVKDFALAHDADLVGITAMEPTFVYEGYDVREPWLIVLGIAMDHERLSHQPVTREDPTAAVEVADQYNRGARAARVLANFILEQGHEAIPHPGPNASAVSLVPAALAAGLGELGKHGSIINRTYGSSFRLAAVATEIPLIADAPDDFGGEDFCLSCQVCTNACPPDAIYRDKQTVRGVHKWYVDFDKCIPYFSETFGCGICIAVCPWSKPGTAPRLAEKMLRRRERNDGS